MDPIHKKVLANKTSEIMKRVSNPGMLVAHLKTIFSPADAEEIEAKASNRGPTAGTQTLLSILEKRGAKAFLLFLHALREEKNEELAEELEEEERKLRGKAGELLMHMKTDQNLKATPIVTLSVYLNKVKMITPLHDTHAKHGNCQSYVYTALDKRNKFSISKEKKKQNDSLGKSVICHCFLITNKGPGDLYRKGVNSLKWERERGACSYRS